AFLSRGRPLGEARVLWEIGPAGSDVRALRSRLDLDSGYLSRLLRSLERDGLVAVERSGADGRVRTARVTSGGLAERTVLDRRSDDAAAAILEPLSARQRTQLVTAMAEVERLLVTSAVRVARCDPRHPDARFCLRAYFSELADRFDGGFDPARSISAYDAELTPPAGLLLVATLHGDPVGCGALKFHDGAPAELKRMWVAPPGGAGARPGRGPAGQPETRGRAQRGAPRPAGDHPPPGRGDQPLPCVRLPRGGRVQRRALRPSLVRKAPGPPFPAGHRLS